MLKESYEKEKKRTAIYDGIHITTILTRDAKVYKSDEVRLCENGPINVQCRTDKQLRDAKDKRHLEIRFRRRERYAFKILSEILSCNRYDLPKSV